MTWTATAEIALAGPIAAVAGSGTDLAVRGDGLSLVDLAAGTRRWHQPIEEPLFGPRPLIIDRGRILTLVSDPAGSGCEVRTYAGATGEILWRQVFTILPAPEPIALVDGRLYVLGGEAGRSRLFMLDMADGDFLGELPCEPSTAIAAAGRTPVLLRAASGVQLGIGSRARTLSAGAQHGTLLTLGDTLYVAVSRELDLADWRVVWWAAGTGEERGRVELPGGRAAPYLLATPDPGGLCAQFDDTLVRLDLVAGEVRWRHDRPDLWSAAWTPMGWATGGWADDPIDLVDDRTGISLGPQGIAGRWPQARLWWHQGHLILSSDDRLLIHVQN